MINLILFIVFDLIWFGLGAGPFFAQQLEPIALLENGSIAPRMSAAIAVYVLMSIGLEVFVLNGLKRTTLSAVAFRGALLGLVVYGVFDFTNRAILAHYPWPMVIVDVLWGTFLFGAVASCSYKLRNTLSF